MNMDSRNYAKWGFARFARRNILIKKMLTLQEEETMESLATILGELVRHNSSPILMDNMIINNLEQEQELK